MKQIVALCALVVLGVPSVHAAQQPAAPPPRLDSLLQMSESVERLVRSVAPGVVQLVVTAYRPLDQPTGQADARIGRNRSVGSGVVIDNGRFIITNAHVIENAERIDAIVTTRDESNGVPLAGSPTRTVPARVVGVAGEFDLALLAVDVTLPALPLADYRSVRQGELVFGIGSPTGLRNSVSMGMVSAAASQADPDSPLVYIQTDAAINPGNSGGPLVNVRGEVVGINTMIRTSGGGSDGLGFALPSALVALAFPQLRDYGHLHRAVTGLAVQTLTPLLRAGLGLATDVGLLVADVAPGSPAEAAGLRAGDVITAIDDERVETLTMAWLYLHLFNLHDRQLVAIDVLRGDTMARAHVKAVVPAHVCERLPGLMDTRDNLVETLGIMGMALDEPAAQSLAVRRGAGVIVVARVDTREAADVPLTKGDVIHTVNGAAVTTPANLRAMLTAIEPGGAVVLQVERDGQLTYVAFEQP